MEVSSDMRRIFLRRVVIVLIFFGANVSVYSQEQCGWDFLRQTASKEQKVAVDIRNELLTKVIRDNRSSRIENNGSVYTIPVVYHIFHLGEPEGVDSNIPESDILASLQELNDRFNDSDGPGADIELDFCLAAQDADGNSSDGIVRIDGRVIEDYEELGLGIGTNCDGADTESLLDLSRWPIENYLNIWVIHDLCGAAAYVSTTPGEDYDGIVIDRLRINGTSTTLTHEVGHWFDLEHTFYGGNAQDCPPNDSCETQGDFICDTAPHRRNDCGFLDNICDLSDHDRDWRFNYMSYCWELDHFTEGQKERMHASMQIWPRNQLTIDAPDCVLLIETTINETSSSLELAPMLFPNPSAGQIDVQLGEFAQEVKVEIYDLQGRKVDYLQKPTTDHVRMNLDLMDGIYMAKVSYNEKTRTASIVIAR